MYSPSLEGVLENRMIVELHEAELEDRLRRESGRYPLEVVRSERLQRRYRRRDRCGRVPNSEHDLVEFIERRVPRGQRILSRTDCIEERRDLCRPDAGTLKL